MGGGGGRGGGGGGRSGNRGGEVEIGKQFLNVALYFAIEKILRGRDHTGMGGNREVQIPLSPPPTTQ